jgi:hypothetical protein
MPSCRRWGWSTTTWSRASDTRGAGESARPVAHDRCRRVEGLASSCARPSGHCPGLTATRIRGQSGPRGRRDAGPRICQRRDMGGGPMGQTNRGGSVARLPRSQIGPRKALLFVGVGRLARIGRGDEI